MTIYTQTPTSKTVLNPVPNGHGVIADVPPQRATDKLRAAPPTDPVSLTVLRPGVDAQALLQSGEAPTAYPELPSSYRVELGRAAEYQAYRIGRAVVLTATGTTLAAVQTDFEVDSRLVYPPQFAFLFRVPTGAVPQATREFRYSEIFQYPQDREFVFIRDADGGRRVKIEESEAMNAVFPVTDKGVQRVVGFSKLSLQDAFDMAVRQAQAEATTDPVADGIVTYTIARSGRLVGGFPGFNSYFAEVEIVV
jgi:hypothetical protein